MQPERKLFKDWFDAEAAHKLAAQLKAAWPAFDQKQFIKRATCNLQSLEFNGRVQQFANALAGTLPTDIPKALKILTRSLPPLLPDCTQVTDGWLQWPVGQYIADHGMPHFDDSMEAMIELTKRFSAEFAVRPFIEAYPDKTYKRLYALTADPNPHVRRWCSEGTRSRLPWGRRLNALIEDPSPSWPILEALRDDSVLYVRKSVANHLNDISKDHPNLVIQRCRMWQKGATPERRWIIRHALRTLIKAGHPDALALLGYQQTDAIAASLRKMPSTLTIGDMLPLNLVIENASKQNVPVAIDYIVHFARPSGKSSRKVFKWTTCDIPGLEFVTIKKHHPFRPVGIRALYPGQHRIEIQVNGNSLASKSFMLTNA